MPLGGIDTLVGPTTGVADIVDDGRPGPTKFTADTLKSYDTPFVRPVTLAPVDVLVPSSKTANGLSPVLNSTT